MLHVVVTILFLGLSSYVAAKSQTDGAKPIKSSFNSDLSSPDPSSQELSEQRQANSIIKLAAKESTDRSSKKSVKIVTSIYPLALVVKAIALRSDQVDVLIPKKASPHDYSLKLSDVKKVRSADLLVWIDQEFEIYMTKAARQAEAEKLLLMEQDQENESHQHLEDHFPDHITGHHHDHSKDVHIWLSPEKMLQAAEKIQLALARINPEKADQYLQNKVIFIRDVKYHMDEITRRFQSKTKPLVYHDAWALWSDAIRQPHGESLTHNPEKQPGASTLLQAKKLIKNGKISCIITEPQFNQKIFMRISKDSGIPLIEVDPLGIDIPFNRNGYVNFLNYLADRFEKCQTEE